MIKLTLLVLVAVSLVTAMPDPADGPSELIQLPAPTAVELFSITWYSQPTYPASGRFRPMSCVEPGDTQYLYVIGGRNGEIYSDCYRYNIRTGQWSTIAPLPEPNCNQAAVWWTDDGVGTDSSGIYVFGRYTPAATYKTCYHWTKATNTWSSTEVPEYPGNPWTGNMAAVVGDSVFLIHRLSQEVCEFHRYSIREGTWEARPQPALPGNYYGAICVADDQVWQLGGWQNSLGFQRYNPATGVWKILPDAPPNTAGNSCCLGAAGGYIWAWGGGNGWTSTNGVACYDKHTNQWSNETSLPENIQAAAYGVLDSAGTLGLHCVCGYRTLAVHYRGTGITTGTAEPHPSPSAPHLVSPTIVRNTLNLPSTTCSLHFPIALLDASGRKVLDLLPGPNDLSRLAPGVYFVCQKSDMRKVIIQR